jgi:hypothetical protein
VGRETGKVMIDLSDERVEIQHPRCGLTTSMSIAEFRYIDSVECPNCGLVLVGYIELIESFKSGLRGSVEIIRRRDRGSTRRHILRDLDRLLNG